MITKMRSDCALASLSPEQREDLYDLFASHSYAEVQEIAAKPADQGGFGLKIHSTTLGRFFRKQQEERHAQELAELTAQSDGVNLPSQIDQLIAGSRVLLARAVYDLALAKKESSDLDRLARVVHNFDIIAIKNKQLALEKDRLDLARERLAEEKRQWEFNAARELMKNLVLYLRIHKTPQIDDETKIWNAREVCFGAEAAAGALRSFSDLEAAKRPLQTQTNTEKHTSPPATVDPIATAADPATPNSAVPPEREIAPSSITAAAPAAPDASAAPTQINTEKHTSAPEPAPSSLAPEPGPTEDGRRSPVAHTASHWINMAEDPMALSEWFLQTLCAKSDERLKAMLASSEAFHLPFNIYQQFCQPSAIAA